MPDARGLLRPCGPFQYALDQLFFKKNQIFHEVDEILFILWNATS